MNLILGVTDFDTDQAFSRLAVLDPNAFIIHVMDLPTGQELLTLPGNYIKFTEAGKHLLALVNNMGTNFLYGYALDTNELITIAATRLTRSWTQEECSKYLHTEVCPTTP